MLEREGLEVVTASDGAEALELFQQAKPDLVILDIVMPRMNGFEACRRIKSDPNNKLTPIIIVTFSSAPENRMKGLEAGADDFLAKPVDRTEMIARVRSLLRIKRYADELESAEAVLLALARSIEGKDPYTQGHCERLSDYAVKFGKRLGLDNGPLQIEPTRHDHDHLRIIIDQRLPKRVLAVDAGAAKFVLATGHRDQFRHPIGGQH